MKTRNSQKKLNPILAPADFIRWAASLGLSQAAIDLIQEIRSSEPSRRTQGRKNVRGHWCSRKMHRTIQFESVSGELTAVVEMEYDPDVLEIWDQAGNVRITYRDKNGRKISFTHTPDFFVISRTFAGWIECKPEDELREESAKAPERYVRQPDGTWRCPPGEAHAARFGLSYRIRSSNESKGELYRNLIYLDDYFHPKCPEPDEKLVARVCEVVSGNQGITYPEVIRSVQGLTTDDLNNIIARNKVYTNLREVLLKDHNSVTLYSDFDIASALRAASETSESSEIGTGAVELVPSAQVSVHGAEYMILDVSDRAVHLVSTDGKNRHWSRSDFEGLIYTGDVKNIVPRKKRQDAILAAISAAGPEGQRIGVERLATLQPYLDESRKPKKKLSESSARAIRRLKKLFITAQLNLGCGFLGLLPKVRTGNKLPRLSSKVFELMMHSIEHDYETSTAISMKAAYERFSTACGNQPVPSEKTYRIYVRSRPQYQQTRRRKGPRAAYQRKPFYWILDSKVPVHGDRPWEICHIDHTELDIELICSKTGRNLGRPWMSIMMDAHTRRILAVCLSFSSESSESNMRLLRECVRRHHRLPKFLVVDQGKGFNAISFDAALAVYEVSKKSRPAAYARHGSVLERLFGTANTQFVHNCIGNTKLTKNVRQVTAGVNPKNLAVWTLEEFYPFLSKYCYEVYDTIDHPAWGVSPREAEARSFESTGQRTHKLVPYDSAFQILTLPTTEYGVAKIHPQKGIHLNYLDYYSEVFLDPKLEGKEVPVRYDPEDSSTAYAFVNGKWIPCVSSYANVFNSWSRKAVEIASEELRKRNRNIAKDRNNTRDPRSGLRVSISARKLADFLKEVATKEEFLLLRSKEAANRAVIAAAVSPTNTADPQPAEPTADTTPQSRSARPRKKSTFTKALETDQSQFPISED